VLVGGSNVSLASTSSATSITMTSEFICRKKNLVGMKNFFLVAGIRNFILLIKKQIIV
jgi:hypothetical protein